MLKNLMKLTWMFAAAVALTLFSTSCEKDNAVNSADVENYTDVAMFELQERAGCGRRGCFEFVFPLTIVFPDATEAEVEDYESLREAIRSWKDNNPDATERPSLAFPIEVVSQDGEVISVEDSDALQELRQSCRRPFGPHRPGHGGKHCFKLVFPLDISFPDGTTATATDARDLKSQLREWRRTNQGSEERPELVFPIFVEMEDGTQVEVADLDALKALKESCSDEG